jgi:hypothetical protein
LARRSFIGGEAVTAGLVDNKVFVDAIRANRSLARAMKRRDFIATAGIATAALITGCESTGRTDLLVSNYSSAAPGATGAAPWITPALYELRIYSINPGKAEALHNRFRNHTLALFKKHGIESIGYWMPVNSADQRLHFLLRYPDREAREASWKAFMADPEWQAAYKESESKGALVSKVENPFLIRTDYSPVVRTGNVSNGGVWELRTYTTPAGLLPNLDARFRDHTIKLFAKHGMGNQGYFHKAEGQPGADTTLVYFLTHRSEAAAKASFDSFRKDPAWTAAREASEKLAGGSLTVTDGVKSVFLAPTDYSPTK